MVNSRPGRRRQIAVLVGIAATGAAVVLMRLVSVTDLFTTVWGSVVLALVDARVRALVDNPVPDAPRPDTGKRESGYGG